MLEAFDEAAGFDRCEGCDNCERMAAHERASAAETPEASSQPERAAAMPPALQPGDAVRVKRYGGGVVVEASAESVTVAFGKERRSFLPQYVKRHGPPARPAAECGFN